MVATLYKSSATTCNREKMDPDIATTFRTQFLLSNIYDGMCMKKKNWYFQFRFFAKKNEN